MNWPDGEAANDEAFFRILSLDGGVRGVFLAAFLAPLEEHLAEAQWEKPSLSESATGGVRAVARTFSSCRVNEHGQHDN
jgi:hypothetical protein